MRFHKWHGLGNDYIILEASSLPETPSPAACELLCDRHFGVGADGLLIHYPPSGAVPGAVARMRIFNPDGSEPEMCGNGIRMFARYLAERGVVGAGESTIETLAGPIRPRLLPDGRVRVHMGVARFKSAAIDSSAWEPVGEIVERQIAVLGETYTFTFVDVGNPHCIIVVDDVSAVPLERVGPALEMHPLFPRRANVEFIQREADGSMRMRVWERGVGETQACGTGATAVGVAAVRLGLTSSPVLVHLPGGDLEIEALPEGEAVMTGPAEEVFVGELSSSMLRRIGWAEYTDNRESGRLLDSRRSHKEARVQFSKRMDTLPPYLFAEIERKIAEKRRAGVDVISLGIGDPDLPTPAYIVEEMQRQIADPRNHAYPSNAGVPEFGDAAVGYCRRRFGVTLDPVKEFFPLLGSKEGLAHICWSTLDAGDVVLVPDPGYPVYAAASLLVGAEVVTMPLRAENGFLPDLEAIAPETAKRAKLMFISYPNNPTAGVVEGDFFERVVEFATRNDIAVVHDNAYCELVFDGYEAPSFLATPGAMDVGVEFFSLSKPFNMTGWRAGFGVGNREILEPLWRLKTNLDSGMFEAVQRTAAFVLNGPWDFVHEMNALYTSRRDVLLQALDHIGLNAPKPKATIYIWVPVPAGYTSTSFASHVLDQAGVVVTPGNGYGAAGEGFVRISLTAPDERIREAVARIERSLRL